MCFRCKNTYTVDSRSDTLPRPITRIHMLKRDSKVRYFQEALQRPISLMRLCALQTHPKIALFSSTEPQHHRKIFQTVTDECWVGINLKFQRFVKRAKYPVNPGVNPLKLVDCFGFLATGDSPPREKHWFQQISARIWSTFRHLCVIEDHQH